MLTLFRPPELLAEEDKSGPVWGMRSKMVEGEVLVVEGALLERIRAMKEFGFLLAEAEGVSNSVECLTCESSSSTFFCM